MDVLTEECRHFLQTYWRATDILFSVSASECARTLKTLREQRKNKFRPTAAADGEQAGEASAYCADMQMRFEHVFDKCYSECRFDGCNNAT